MRLGEGVAQSGLLGEAAMERTVAALGICAERLRKLRVRKMRAMATQACRRAANVRVLIDRVASETGIRLEIVDAAEEAHLAAVGCAPLIGEDYRGALVFDIGGGSTEAIWLGQGGRGRARAFRLGAARRDVAGGGRRESSFAAMRETMLARFAAVRREMDKKARSIPRAIICWAPRAR